ncbi:MAG: glucokinase [Deltaproteobacteria bacterium]|nr:glucokinase [Deltaproteobacteria bacterium]
MHCLAADVGGTKTWLAVFGRSADGGYRAIRSQRYESAAYDNFDAMVREFMAAGSEPVRRVGVGVAGPVANGKCVLTNLHWEIDERRLAAELGLERVSLVNDFVAVALGIPSLGAADLAVLQQGNVDPAGPVAILGAGTGLGEAILLATEGGLRVLPTEGGHTGLAPNSPREIRLLEFLHAKFGHVSWERVLSGPGIKNLYDFLLSEGAPESPATRARLETEDAGAVIGGLAVAGSDPTCVETLDLFGELYGSEAGDLALKTLATGGVYVAGGIAPRVLSILKNGKFIAAFNAKGRMARLTASFRVAVVLQSQVGLIGACRAGLGELGTAHIFLRA